MKPNEFEARRASRTNQKIRIEGDSSLSVIAVSYRTQVLGKQLRRCGTSVAANYRAVCRARSKAEFIARIGIVAEEADEAVLWLELLIESDVVAEGKASDLLTEAKELAAIFTASQQTSKKGSKL